MTDSHHITRTLIRGARVVDPASNFDAVADIAIEEHRIVAIGAMPTGFKPERTVDAKGLVALPGLVDLAARVREPGREHEGMLESELAAAAAGGVTSIVCPPDTDPPLDEPGLVEMLKLRARKLGYCRLFPLGALTRGLKGEALTEMAELVESGCVGFSQADVPIVNTQTLMRAMQYASTFGYTVWLRPQDAWLGHGVAASGPVATRLGLASIPVAAETIALHATFELMRATGARVHLARLSSAAGVALVRAAKLEGLPVTADVSIQSLHLTDMDIGFFESAMRLLPPLRQARDRDALQVGLADGTIDALVSDHNPVEADAKQVPFAEAEPGATGVELLLSLAIKWGQERGLSLSQSIAPVTTRAAHVLGDALGHHAASAGRLVVGGSADLCLVDLDTQWHVTPGALRSQGKHTPFAFELNGFSLPARVQATWVAGASAFEAAGFADQHGA